MTPNAQPCVSTPLPTAPDRYRLLHSGCQRSGNMSDSSVVANVPRIEKRTRRRVSIAVKKRLPAETRCHAARRDRLASSQGPVRRPTVNMAQGAGCEHSEAGLSTRKPGCKHTGPRDKQPSGQSLHLASGRSKGARWKAEPEGERASAQPCSIATGDARGRLETF